VYGPNPPLPPLDSGVSASSYKLISGGSFSSPAAHYCPVCGIIATSQANLEVCTPPPSLLPWQQQAQLLEVLKSE